MAGKHDDIYRHFRLPEREPPSRAVLEAIQQRMNAQLRMIADLAIRHQRRRKPPGTAAAPVPADPRKPDTLSGGAAAALDFD